MDRKTEILKKQFFDYVDERQLVVGDRLPTEAELSTLFGISRTTVRGAFAALEREGVIERRRGAGTFLTRRAAGRSNIIAIMVPSFSPDPERQGAYDRIVQSIEYQAYLHKYSTILCRTDNQVEKAFDYLRRIRGNNVAGIIYTPLGTGNAHRDNLAVIAGIEAEQIPYVVIDNFISDGSLGRYSFVGSDNYKIMRDLVGYMLGRNYRRPACIRGFPGGFCSDERFFGFRDGMAQAGIPLPDEYVRVMEETPLPQQGCREIEALLALPEPPDAVVCIHDVVAGNVIEYLNRHRVRIPQDMAVVGFDDIARAQHMTPPLTTVRQQFDVIGRKAAEILFEKLDGRLFGERQEFVRCLLVPRESC